MPVHMPIQFAPAAPAAPAAAHHPHQAMPMSMPTMAMFGHPQQQVQQHGPQLVQYITTAAPQCQHPPQQQQQQQFAIAAAPPGSSIGAPMIIQQQHPQHANPMMLPPQQQHQHQQHVHPPRIAISGVNVNNTNTNNGGGGGPSRFIPNAAMPPSSYAAMDATATNVHVPVDLQSGNVLPLQQQQQQQQQQLNNNSNTALLPSSSSSSMVVAGGGAPAASSTGTNVVLQQDNVDAGTQNSAALSSASLGGPPSIAMDQQQQQQQQQFSMYNNAVAVGTPAAGSVVQMVNVNAGPVAHTGTCIATGVGGPSPSVMSSVAAAADASQQQQQQQQQEQLLLGENLAAKSLAEMNAAATTLVSSATSSTMAKSGINSGGRGDGGSISSSKASSSPLIDVTETGRDSNSTSNAMKRVSNQQLSAALARMESSETLTPSKRPRSHQTRVKELFPIVLYRILEDAEKEGFTQIISFAPHGRSFAIHKMHEFEEKIMPKYFQHARSKSFRRQLNLYDYSRINEGPDCGGYFHEYFLKGRRDLLFQMRRTKIKGVNSKNLSSNLGVTPNFYAMPPIEKTTSNGITVLAGSTVSVNQDKDDSTSDVSADETTAV